MKLIIVESPTKAKTLIGFLGGGYQVEASMGHVRDLPKKRLGIDPEADFKPEYEIVAGKQPIVAKLKKLAKTSSEVILATDPDREGEAIAWHIQELIKVKSQRIVFHEITRAAIESALKNPGVVDLKLVEAQFCRRALDRLVGYNLSPILWQKVRRGLSAGRVQSVAVRLIVEREEEIEAFKPTEYWDIFTENSKDGQKFRLKLDKVIPDKETSDQAVSALKQADYEVEKINVRLAQQRPLPPFITSTLQRAAGSRLGWSAKKTMREAQQLYEEGLITYHRTDSLNLSQEAIAEAREFIGKNYGQKYLPEQPQVYRNNSKNVQAAHEAIRPTDINRAENNKLYRMIWERFIGCQMNPALVEKTLVIVKAAGYQLKAEGQRVVFDGWWKAAGRMKLENQELPKLSVKDKLELIRVLAEQKFTEPKSRYTEASLIKVLEEKGIGRPSTYAPILSTIQERNYVEKKDKKLRPTAIGTAVTKFLLRYFPKIMDYDFTAEMESGLDDIAKGGLSSKDLLRNFYSDFSSLLSQVKEKAERAKIEVEKTGEKCPECGQGELVVRTGRFGKFLSCLRFPECKYTGNYQEVVEGIKCPECQAEVIVKKTKKGKQFYGCSRYPDCKWASWNKPRL